MSLYIVEYSATIKFFVFTIIMAMLICDVVSSYIYIQFKMYRKK